SNGLSRPMSIAPRLRRGSSAGVGPRTLSTISAPKASSSLPIFATAPWNSQSGRLDGVPAPAQTSIACLPLAASFFTVSGVAATRVSPARVSRGMPMIMVSAPLPAVCSCSGRYLATNALPDCVGDRAPELAGVGLAAQVGGARAFGERTLDAAHHRGRRVGVAQVLEHHGAAPDLADRVGDPLAGDVRRRAVHRLE